MGNVLLPEIRETKASVVSFFPFESPTGLSQIRQWSKKDG